MSSTDTDDPPAARRRLRLAPLRSVPVDFAGARDGRGPLTLGQLNILRTRTGEPDEFLANLYGELVVPAGVSVDDVAATIGVLLGRHEGLRSTWVDGAPPYQTFTATGVFPLEVCTLGEGRWGPGDRPAVAEALIRWLRQTPATSGFPVRVAVATASDDTGTERVVGCVAEYSHLAVDHRATTILGQEFAELVGDPAARHVGGPRHQPLEQAAAEAAPAARRQAERSLQHMVQLVRRMPRCLYPAPGALSTGESLAVRLSSSAAATAVRRIAARTRTSRSGIVLAAICAVLAQRTGRSELVFPLTSSNRFEAHLARYVGTLAQDSTACVDVGTRHFDALAMTAWTAVLDACRHGRYDTASRAELFGRIEHERGLRFTNGALFNNLATESPAGSAVGHRPEQVLGRTELRWRPMTRTGTQLRFVLDQVEGRVLLDAWSDDSGQISRTELESLLLAVERLLVAAAHGDLDGDRIREAVAMDPLPRGPDRLLVDSCWVDLADVQHLLDDALTPGTARIFPSVNGHPLVAHVVATDDVRTPEQAHARCMAALPRHPGALTPRHYRIYATAPADPADHTAWQAIVDAGTGRTAVT